MDTIIFKKHVTASFGRKIQLYCIIEFFVNTTSNTKILRRIFNIKIQRKSSRRAIKTLCRENMEDSQEKKTIRNFV